MGGGGGFEGGEGGGGDVEVGPCMLVGRSGVDGGWVWFSDDIVEFRTWVVGGGQEGNGVGSSCVDRVDLDGGEGLVAASFGEESHDVSKSSHVESCVVRGECEYESAFDVVGL